MSDSYWLVLDCVVHAIAVASHRNCLRSGRAANCCSSGGAPRMCVLVFARPGYMPPNIASVCAPSGFHFVHGSCAPLTPERFRFALRIGACVVTDVGRSCCSGTMCNADALRFQCHVQMILKHALLPTE